VVARDPTAVTRENQVNLVRYFRGFLRARRSARLFRRPIVLDSLSRGRRLDAPSDAHNRRLASQAQIDLADLLAQLGTSDRGLSNAEAEALREQHGLNQIEHEGPMPWWQRVWVSYNNPFNLLLTLLAAVSYFTDDIQAAVVIGLMVLLATTIRFFQERRSNLAAQALRRQVGNTASVRRRAGRAASLPDRDPARPFGNTIEVPIEQLVPGDIVVLSAGDMIPADCRVMTATDLFVGQSALTGESLPVEKFPAAGAASGSALTMDNLVFIGTNVISGAATVVVLATGSQSSRRPTNRI
jgi:Mg2+-importing ATPase